MKPPLRTVLRNFLNHFEDYESRRKLCDDQYEKEFQQLKKLTDKLKSDSEYSSFCALKDVNRPKNRYKDIVPYDKSRVVLSKCDGVPGSDYINASHVKGASGALAYIAAQGPLPNTVIDFWRMIWICDVQVIVMACNETESGKNKCEKYWPSKGEIKHYGNISVELINTSQVCHDFLIRTLLIKCDSEMRDVYQFHYTSWPDHGIPDTVHPILELVRLMRQCQASETMPIVVHCSAGCGRTGTICAVDFVWACLRHGKLSEDFSLFEIAMELRRQRIAMIQTKEQYILAHKAVATLFEQQLNVIDCHPYVNIDEDGEPLIWKELTKSKNLNFKEVKTKIEPSVNISSKKRNFALDIDNPATENDCKNRSSVEKLTNEALKRNSLNGILETEALSKEQFPSKSSISDSLADCSRHSESSFSRNSYLSQQSSEDIIPFIDDDEVCIRPQCGRAYLNIPSCDSISKLVNRFDPFVDRVTIETDDSSPEADSKKSFVVKSDVSNHSYNVKIPLKIDGACLSMQDACKSQTSTCEKSFKTEELTKFNKRESYPSTAGRSIYNDSDSVDDKISIQSENIKGTKKVGRATVVRRPSVSKLKALFERSGISSNRQSDGGKRLLFRSNTHHVSRAGSAPPSLNCMDKNAAVEKESVLMMVTRKFRSASVRTEREITNKSCSKSQKKGNSSSGNSFKEGFATLSRTVSFNLNKKFRSSPSTLKVETSEVSNNNPIYKEDVPNNDEISNLSPTASKSKSTWYDKSSLPRVVAVVKPTEKRSITCEQPTSPTSKKIEKNKSGPFSFSINKPPKLLPFLSTLNRTDQKDTTMWYSEMDNMYVKSIPTDTLCSSNETKSDNISTFHKDNSNKVLPLISSLKPWKKIGFKTASTNSDTLTSSFNNSPTFYTHIQSSPESNPASDNVSIHLVPDEIIPLNSLNVIESPSNKSANASKQSNNILTELSSANSSSPAIKSDSLECNSGQTTENVDTCDNCKSNTPPAIPKKMHAKRNQDNSLIKEDIIKDQSNPTNPFMAHESIDDHKKEPLSSSNDLYINVNETAKKNIEQIEKAIQNNPRSAIIDLTSRESYCMEEELALAVKQLASPKPLTKINSKFPGYEIIWPEDKISRSDQTKSSNEVSMPCKTGICYSPPLRRSFKANMNLSKSSSCSNIDWLETNDTLPMVGTSKDRTSSPTKKLVKEAAAELNTLLDRLTSQTLSETIDINNKDRDMPAISNNYGDDEVKKSTSSSKEISGDSLMTHSVTLISKSNNSSSSPKEEEIVFHFPPPPKNPPPEDVTSERFDIIVKNGSLIVSPNENQPTEQEKNMSDFYSDSKATQIYPQPAPRKSKIRKSASYTNLWAPQSKGYENIFLAKFQTLSRLQIDPDCNLKSDSFENNKKSETVLSIQAKPPKNMLPDYVNVKDLASLSSSYCKKSVNSKSDQNSSDTIFSKEKPSHKNTGLVNQSSSDMSRSYPEPSAIDSSARALNIDDSFSIYGKIHKVPFKKVNNEDNNLNQHPVIPKTTNNVTARHLIYSKKQEQTPFLHGTQLVLKPKEVPPKVDSCDRITPKKFQSRKQEKAPLPPPLLLKSSSAASVAKANLPHGPHYANFSRLQCHEQTHILPAVRENIANADSYSKLLVRREVEKKEHSGHTPSRSLAHSQSDASVFFALKERKALSLNRGQKLPETQMQITNKLLKRNKELPSVSSSDSDSSYERIFFDKPGENLKKGISHKEQTLLNPVKDFHKELPVAPPRSRRRNTTEIHYAKVKSKESTPQPIKIVKSNLQKSGRSIYTQDAPPAIPLKTRDAFEIPKEQTIESSHQTPATKSDKSSHS